MYYRGPEKCGIHEWLNSTINLKLVLIPKVSVLTRCKLLRFFWCWYGYITMCCVTSFLSFFLFLKKFYFSLFSTETLLSLHSDICHFCCCSVVQLWTTARQASLSITISWSLLKLTSIKSVMLSNHLILWHPLLLLSSIFPSSRIFSNDSVLSVRRPKYWSFSFSISPSSEYSGLISYHLHITFSSVVLRQLKACFLWHQCSHEHKQIWSLVIQITPNMLILIYKRVTCKFFWRNSICSLREALTNGLCGQNFFWYVLRQGLSSALLFDHNKTRSLQQARPEVSMLLTSRPWLLTWLLCLWLCP